MQKKIIGKPCTGKLYARFDEGELEKCRIRRWLACFLLYPFFKGLLEVITGYAKTWLLLQRYDENSLEILSSTKEQLFVLDHDEAKAAIVELKRELMVKQEASDLFGNEKSDELTGIIRSIYQTFGGEDLIPSVEEKAANLLYYIIKDHPFSDGNKRIGSFLFILFLAKMVFCTDRTVSRVSMTMHWLRWHCLWRRVLRGIRN